MGRPSSFTQEVADSICLRIIEGESLTQMCREEEMPSKFTVLRWLGIYPEFSSQYARAREAQQDTLADQAREIAAKATPEDVNVARLQVDVIKWHTSKLAPKKYGDKVQHSGDEENPILIKRVVSDL